MTLNRLNDIVILHVHLNEDVENERVANTFINKTSLSKYICIIISNI